MQIQSNQEGQQGAIVCPFCGCLMKAVFPQKYQAGESVRCAKCFDVFVLIENK